MKLKLKNKLIALTGLIAAAIFFASAAALARLDMSFIDNLSLRTPDAPMGRTVPFVIKGATLYLTSLDANLATGLTWATFAALALFAAALFAGERILERGRH